MTAVAIAFARNPMTVAQHGVGPPGRVGRARRRSGSARRSARTSSAGSRCRGRRPAARMREFVGARARDLVDVAGRHAARASRASYYRHTLMTPFFTPEPSPTGPPRLFLAGVGPAMTAVAGDVADGFFVHPFSTPDYLRSTTLPALRAGRRGVERRVRDRVAGDDRDRRHRRGARRRRARDPRRRSRSTRRRPRTGPSSNATTAASSSPVLRERTKTDDWSRLLELVDDDLFDLVAIRGTPGRVRPRARGPDRRARGPGGAERALRVGSRDLGGRPQGVPIRGRQHGRAAPGGARTGRTTMNLRIATAAGLVDPGSGAPADGPVRVFGDALIVGDHRLFWHGDAGWTRDRAGARAAVRGRRARRPRRRHRGRAPAAARPDRAHPHRRVRDHARARRLVHAVGRSARGAVARVHRRQRAARQRARRWHRRAPTTRAARGRRRSTSTSTSTRCARSGAAATSSSRRRPSACASRATAASRGACTPRVSTTPTAARSPSPTRRSSSARPKARAASRPRSTGPRSTATRRSSASPTG